MSYKGLERWKTASNVHKNKNIEKGEEKLVLSIEIRMKIKKTDVDKEAEKWKQTNVEFRKKFSQFKSTEEGNFTLQVKKEVKMYLCMPWSNMEDWRYSSTHS